MGQIILNIPSWIWAILVGALVFIFDYTVQRRFNTLSGDNNEQTDTNRLANIRSFARALFFAGLSLMFSLSLENLRKLESIQNELISVNEKATAFDFFKPYETIQKLEDNSTFQKLLKFQMNQTRQRLLEIEKSELNLSREEVIPVWEALISKYTTNEINATNVVSIKDWEKFSPNQGLEAHEEFFNKPNTKFKRLFVYDNKDTLSIKGTDALAKKQLEMSKKMNLNGRFEIRIINKNSIDNTTYGTTMYSNFGTLDLVIFDNECLLQTITQYKNNAYEIVNGVVTNKKQKVDLAKEMFNKLWEKAQTYEEYKSRISGNNK